jgi:hypothetical protein
LDYHPDSITYETGESYRSLLLRGGRWGEAAVMSEDRDLLAEAVAHFARAAAFYREWRFILEIEEERRRDFLAERPITRDNGDYHV